MDISLTFLGCQGAFEVEDTSQSVEEVLDQNFAGWKSRQIRRTGT
jgi:hypothetical protein